METHRTVVVKPARGEQGEGISVGITDRRDLETAIKKAKNVCRDVILEELAPGQDLRVIVINYEVVAAAVRRPPVIRGTGTHTVKELIKIYNRRRMAATGGESRIPHGRRNPPVPGGTGPGRGHGGGQRQRSDRAKNRQSAYRRHHHDVTDELHPELAKAAVSAARCLEFRSRAWISSSRMSRAKTM